MGRTDRTDGTDPVHAIRDHLRERAHVFEDPVSYVAGVDDALDSMLELGRVEVHPGRTG
jgi:hypothetical protein